MNKFSKVLKDLMEEKSISVEKLQKDLDLDSSSIIYHWLDDNSKPKFNNLIKLVEYFSCSLDYLLGRTNEYSNGKYKNPEKFSKQLEKVMQEKGVSQYKMTQDKICTTWYFTKWKKLNAEPQVETLIKLADYLGVTVDYLVGRE